MGNGGVAAEYKSLFFFLVSSNDIQIEKLDITLKGKKKPLFNCCCAAFAVWVGKKKSLHCRETFFFFIFLNS